MNADGTLHEQAVQVGIETSADAEITSGLSEGQQVVISDRSGLRNGEKVRPQVIPVTGYTQENTQQ